MATKIFESLFRRAPKATPAIKFPYSLANNPYRCKRTWPPDFSQLSAQHRLRLEKRYRKRTQLKWARPTWTKAVILTQWGSILFVAVYGVLFLEVNGEETPFDPIRAWYREQVGNLMGSRSRVAVGTNTDTMTKQNG